MLHWRHELMASWVLLLLIQSQGTMTSSSSWGEMTSCLVNALRRGDGHPIQMLGLAGLFRLISLLLDQSTPQPPIKRARLFSLCGASSEGAFTGDREKVGVDVKCMSVGLLWSSFHIVSAPLMMPCSFWQWTR